MALKAKGTKLLFADAERYQDAVSWTKIATVRHLTPPKRGFATQETTTLDDDFDDFEATLGRSGEIDLLVAYDKSAVAQLGALAGVKKGFKLQYPDKSGWLMNGAIIEEGEEEIQPDGLVQTQLKIKLSGKAIRVDDVTTWSSSSGS